MRRRSRRPVHRCNPWRSRRLASTGCCRKRNASCRHPEWRPVAHPGPAIRTRRRRIPRSKRSLRPGNSSPRTSASTSGCVRLRSRRCSPRRRRCHRSPSFRPRRCRPFRRCYRRRHSRPRRRCCHPLPRCDHPLRRSRRPRQAPRCRWSTRTRRRDRVRHWRRSPIAISEATPSLEHDRRVCRDTPADAKGSPPGWGVRKARRCVPSWPPDQGGPDGPVEGAQGCVASGIHPK